MIESIARHSPNQSLYITRVKVRDNHTEVVNPAMTVKAIGHQWYLLESFTEVELEAYEVLFVVTGSTLVEYDNRYRLTPQSTDCKEIVVAGGMGSTVGLGKFPQFVALQVKLSMYMLFRMIGHLLGDSHSRLTSLSLNANANFSFTQGPSHLSYLLWVFNYLAPICNRLPRFTTQNTYTIDTRTLPVLTALWSMFYVAGVSGKVIKDELFPYLASPIVIATWFMDDGSNHLPITDGWVVSTFMYKVLVGKVPTS
jgi:hypothetical protein